MNKESSNPIFGIYILVNIFLAILAVPYFAAALISGYIEYMSFDWVLIFFAFDLFVLGGLSLRWENNGGGTE